MPALCSKGSLKAFSFLRPSLPWLVKVFCVCDLMHNNSLRCSWSQAPNALPSLPAPSPSPAPSGTHTQRLAAGEGNSVTKWDTHTLITEQTQKWNHTGSKAPPATNAPLFSYFTYHTHLKGTIIKNVTTQIASFCLWGFGTREAHPGLRPDEKVTASQHGFFLPLEFKLSEPLSIRNKHASSFCKMLPLGELSEGYIGPVCIVVVVFSNSL